MGEDSSSSSSSWACKGFHLELLPAPQQELIPKDSWAAGVALRGHRLTGWAPSRVHCLQRTSPKPQLDRACAFQSLVSSSVHLCSLKAASFGQGGKGREVGIAGTSGVGSLVRRDRTAQPTPEPFLLWALCHLSTPAWGTQMHVSERESFQGASSTPQRGAWESAGDLETNLVVP